MESQTYSTLPEGHVRLLSIDPNQDPPSGHLTVVALKDAPKFNALSYAWGEPGTTLDFSCSGDVLRVHENLADFLRLASARYYHQPIWIDAVCINQNDDMEKNHQIPLMRRIYCMASQVLVWLGTNSEQGDEAFAYIPTIAVAYEVGNVMSHANKLSLELCLSLIQLPPWTSPIWLNIGEIFTRSWFRRLWVMQEVYQSPNIKILCGSGIIEWRELLSLLGAILRGPIKPLRLCTMANGEEVCAGISLAKALAVLRDDLTPLGMEFDEAFAVSHLLTSIRGRIAMRPIDKVYGVLAVMPPDIEQSLTVDVSLSTPQVYTAFAKYLLRRGNASLILSHASHSVEGLPSWCPNFAEGLSAVLLAGHGTQIGFKAGYESEPSGKEQVKMLENCDTIEAVGFDFDVILETLSSESAFDNHKSILKWDQACFEMTERYYDPSNYHIMLQDLCEARTAGYRHDVNFIKLSPLRSPDYTQDYNCWKLAAKNHELILPHASQPAYRFCASCQWGSKGRRFFIGKGKSMGSAPLAAQVGDSVCVLYGRPTPFILRRNPDQSTYRLIGEAYVNGLMDGQAFKLRDKHSIPDQTFVMR
jgi:Heterokaryon incompatibility protein (HET)